MESDAVAKVAVPSDHPGGLDAPRSQHFGRAACFTVAEVGGGQAEVVKVVEIDPHRQGGCMIPVYKLAGMGVKDVVVDRIGKRPLAGFAEVGIAVYVGEGETVGDALTAFSQGRLSLKEPEEICTQQPWAGQTAAGGD